ncbi:sulfotransferase 6B1-like isoform X2 [Eleutherodactylus coqui]|uniref:sulfotransferase 6B1-like isoform X2 n=1 Tax=Eleutherodactylus coqui TaxID=57060 RepID=UPI003461F611
MSDSTEQNKSNWEKFQAEMKRMVEEEVKGKTPEELKMTYKGIRYPSSLCSVPSFEAMERFEAREDDVLIITYPKCGTHWSKTILHEMLLEVHGKEPTVDRIMFEFGKPEKYEILIIMRNPKDAAVSYYHFTNNLPVLPTYSSWDLFFKDFISGDVLFGSYFDYHLGWDRHIDDGNILVLTFEDMKADLPAELKKINDFYGLNLTDEQILQIEEKTIFKSMKEKSSNTHGKLADAFFRKGEIGDWKSLFTEEQSKEVDAKFEKYLAGTKLGEKINYRKFCTF